MPYEPQTGRAANGRPERHPYEPKAKEVRATLRDAGLSIQQRGRLLADERNAYLSIIASR
jgi:hypothetical protein